MVDRDSELFEQVKRATAAMRPRPEVVACTRIAALGVVVASEGPFDVLVAGSSVVGGTGLVSLRRLRMEHPATVLVMASAHRPSGSFREIIRAGAVDVLQLPLDDEAVGEAVGDAIAIASRFPALPEPKPAELRPGAAEGALITVVSATGGSGKTFLATNVAYYLHTQHELRVCLVDLDLQFGELATALRLRPRYTITDAIARDDRDESEMADRLAELVVRHDTGLYVLAGPSDPAAGDAVEASEVVRLLTALRATFDVVVVDTPAALSEPVLAAVDVADQIVAVGTLDLPSVRNMGILLSTLKQLKIPEGNVQLVLNKVEKDVGIDVAQVTKYFPQGFAIVLPYGREVSRSLNMGMPILAYQPTSEVSRALQEGMAALPLPLPLQGRRVPENGAGKEPRRRRGMRQRLVPGT